MNPGFERFPEPVTNLFPRLSPTEAVRRYGLDAPTIAAYRRDGFLPRRAILLPPELAILRERLDALLARLDEIEPELYEIEAAHRERPHEVVVHFLGGWRVDPVLHDLLFHPAIVVPAAELLGVPALRFWHDQVFSKPPHHPGIVPWHQDYSYWTRSAPAAHLTVNLMLDDATPESGCLHFVPGSHRGRLLPKVAFDGPMEQLCAALDEEERARFRPVPAPLSAGEATFHDAHTIHGSPANRSARPRRAIVLNYMAASTRVADGQEPLLRGVPPIPAGAVIEGPFFPIVFRHPGRPA